MWFGNEQRMQWVPCPRTGMGAQSIGHAEELDYETGRKGVFRTHQTHREFEMQFPVQEAAGATGLDVFSRYASGLYGDGTLYPLFFADPMNYSQNLMPPGWAAPGLFARGWASIVSETAVEFRNLATNPSSEIVSAGYLDIDGTSGVATIARTSSGPQVSGAWSARVTWSTGTSAVSGGIAYMGTSVSSANSYTFSAYPTTSKIQRIRMTIRFKTAGGATVSTVNGTETVTAANTPTQLTVVATPPATAVQADIEVTAVAGTSGANWAAADWISLDAVMIQFTNTASPTYFDGSFPNATWTGGSHNSSSYMYIGRSVPTITNTASNSFSLPAQQATWTITTAANAYPTPNNSLGEIPYALIPIPPTHVLHIGACGSATGTAVVKVHAFNAPGDPAAPANNTSLTLLSSTGSTRLNASFSGASYQYAKVFVTRTSTATSTITLSSIMAQLWPIGTSPTLTGNFIPGQGHRGLKFTDAAYAEEYIMADRTFKGLSCRLVEAQDRG